MPVPVERVSPGVRNAPPAPILFRVTRTVLGHVVQRVEDPALLTGEAQFLADLRVEGLVHAVFVRSTVAHGMLRSVDTSGAAGLPDVVAALTADDLDLPEQGRARLGALARPLLAVDRVRFVGEAVAVVVAESFAAAVDATEAVVVDVEPLPVVIDPVRAASDGATLLFPGHGTNVAGGRHHDADDAFFADDDVVVSARLVHQRVAPVPMESNGALAVPAADGSLTLWASTQGVFGVRDEVCTILGLAPEQVRVSGAVGRRWLRSQGRHVSGTGSGRRAGRAVWAVRCDGWRRAPRTCSA